MSGSCRNPCSADGFSNASASLICSSSIDDTSPSLSIVEVLGHSIRSSSFSNVHVDCSTDISGKTSSCTSDAD